MKNFIYPVYLLILVAALSSCKSKKAIEIVKKSRVTTNSMLFNLYLNTQDGYQMTWESLANMHAKQTPNIKYFWTSKKTNEQGIFLVAFADDSQSGLRWQVDLNNEIVIFINDDEYLSRKYGLHRRDSDNNFELTGIEIDSLRFFRKGSTIHEIDYQLTCSIINRTGKRLTFAEINGKLSVIFKDKTITGESTYLSGFVAEVNSSRPWNPDTERKIKIKTKSIDGLYLNYKPEFVFFDLSLKATDPIGFIFNRDIYEKDLLQIWNKYKESLNNIKLYDYYVTTEITNFYSEPSTKSKKLGYLKKGLNVSGIAFVDTRWIKVNTKTIEGYVEIKSLKPISNK